MRVLIGPSILLCSFMSSAYGGAWVPEHRQLQSSKA